jgi:hypothetical protein
MKLVTRINPAFFLATSLMFISAFTPWFGARIGKSEWSVEPIFSSAMRLSTIALLAMAMIGILLDSRTLWGQYLVGLSTAIWGSCCLWAWLIGAQLRNWLPSGVVPKGLIPNVRMGVLFGVIAIFIVLIETFSPSWIRTRIGWRWLLKQGITLSVVILIIATRDIPWASFRVEDYFFEIAPQSVPVLGEIYGICCLTVAISLIWASLGSAMAPKIVSLVTSILILAMGFLSIALRSGVNWLSRISLDLAGLDNQEIRAVEQHSGPQMMVVAGLAALAVSIYLLWNREEAQVDSFPRNEQPSRTSGQFDGAKFL